MEIFELLFAISALTNLCMGLIGIALLNKESHLTKRYMKHIDKYTDFRSDVKRVLWNIGNQTEKVESSLIRLSTRYQLHGHDSSRAMARKIKERLK